MMTMTATRRAFLGGAASLAVWPSDVWGATRAEAFPEMDRTVWEKPGGDATDGVMVRRLYLDLAGRIPTREEAQAYVRSQASGKREALVDELLASPAFADYWTMRFGDVLRVKSEFPINLWPNAVYVYHARIRSFVESNESWERFGRALIQAQGSNFRDAEANFYRATDMRDPDGWAAAVLQTFLGLEPERVPDGLRRTVAGFLANLRLKTTREWKAEVVYVDGLDRRGELCDWLFGRHGQAVADAFGMRLRTWLFGPAAAHVPATGAERGGVKDVVRALVLSPAYARGSVTGGFPARRLDAEVLDDVFCRLSGSARNYQSPAPEPFTYLPPDRPTVCIEDGSVTSGFLSLFGRPARDTGRMDERGSEVTAKQRLYLFNSSDLNRKIARIVSEQMDAHAKMPLVERAAILYWTFLSRAPSAYERTVVRDEWRRRRAARRKGLSERTFLHDVAWSLVNTKEFLFRT